MRKIDDVTTTKSFNEVTWKPGTLFQDMESGMISCRTCTAYINPTLHTTCFDPHQEFANCSIRRVAQLKCIRSNFQVPTAKARPETRHAKEQNST